MMPKNLIPLLLCLMLALPVMATGAEAPAITTLGYGSRYSAAFTQQTGIAVKELLPRGGEAFDRLITAMLTKDDSVDLFGFYAREGLRQVKQKGFYTDLSQSRVLADASRELFPALQKAAMKDGEIAAWPVATMALFMGLEDDDEDGVMKRGALPIPQTWDDALDLVQQLEKEDYFYETGGAPFDQWNYCQAEMLKCLVQEYLLHQTAGGQALSFDTPVFRRLAQRILSQVPRENPYIRLEGYEPTLFNTVGSNVDWGTYHLPLRIDRDGPTHVVLRTRVFILNPYSKNKEAALRYLAFLAQKRTPEDYGLYATLNEPIVNQEAYARWEAAAAALMAAKQAAVDEADRLHHAQRLHQMEEELRLLAQERYRVSQASIDTYHCFARHFVVLEDALILYNEKLGGMVDRLVEGGLSLEGFIREASDYIRLASLEQGRGEE